MDHGDMGWGCVCGVDSFGSGQGPMAGCCEYGDELSDSGATELRLIAMLCHSMIRNQCYCYRVVK
jgi:hypothetical protein